MPLAELQTALGTMIALQAAGALPVATQAALQALSLTPAERAWLTSLPGARGFQVSCDIQRWWRETRLRDTVRLTLAALGADAAAMLTAYLQAHLCDSLFFLPESLRFLQFVAEQTTHPLIRAVAQFERAMLQARETAVREEIEEAATIIVFAAPPEAVLAAVLQGLPLPALTRERFSVVVSAHLPHFWGVARVTEA